MASANIASPDGRRFGRRLRVGGQVQGVGFRPFVYRLARAYGLVGWVRNTVGEVEIRVSGAAPAVEAFTRELVSAAPAIAAPRLRELEDGQPDGEDDFRILPSCAAQEPRISVPPDYFTCPDCLRELADPDDRRHAYPFINCTQCGPRYTLIRGLPYDRENTSMADFPLCAPCRCEYEDPADRRFHAEPVACPDCGPALCWHDARGLVHGNEAALDACVRALESGRLVAVKGIGGYHLVCDAANEIAIARLRRLKPRPSKPLAVMFPLRGADGLAALRACADPGADEAVLLASPQRPIVLVPRRPGALPDSLAPGLDELGAPRGLWRHVGPRHADVLLRSQSRRAGRRGHRARQDAHHPADLRRRRARGRHTTRGLRAQRPCARGARARRRGPGERRRQTEGR
jgi:hydrogenase maturation protein HypF